MKIQSFTEFGTYQDLVEARRELYINIFNQFEEVKPHLNEAYLLIESGVFDDLHLYDEIDESVVSRLMDKTQAAIETMKEKGKQALSDRQKFLVKTGGKVGAIINVMIGALKKWVKDQWEAAKQAYNSAFSSSSDEIKSKVRKMGEEKRNLLKTEIKNLKTVASSVGSWIQSGFTADVNKAAKASANLEESIGHMFELNLLRAINETVVQGKINFAQLVNEGGGVNVPFLSSIAAGMNKVPPFSLLYKVKKGAAKIAGSALNKFSYYATEIAGAPGPYEFVATSTLIGIVGEVLVKKAAKSAIIHAIPGLGTVAYLISNIAMGLAAVSTIETALSSAK